MSCIITSMGYHNVNWAPTSIHPLQQHQSASNLLVVSIIGSNPRTASDALRIFFLEIGVGWVYMLSYNACSGRTTHPTYTAPHPETITESLECRRDGELPNAPGRHHCSTCGVCRLEFDHHCPWLGNCVTTGRMKAFLTLLAVTSVTVPLASLPILPVLKSHVVAALAVSHADTWITDVWWDRPYSWILCGGPPGRWIVGTLLGFHVLRVRRVPEPWLSGSVIVQPHARIVILVGAAALLWVVRVSTQT
ncbi:DHHC palmitoyltransferase-domain-containing protein [Lactarius hengduanensis]|nr:DHHC palmitoyltransferase-domain-containing protein [Lactarius hengduanensis]